MLISYGKSLHSDVDGVTALRSALLEAGLYRCASSNLAPSSREIHKSQFTVYLEATGLILLTTLSVFDIHCRLEALTAIVKQCAKPPGCKAR